MKRKKIHIVVVDDDPDYTYLIEESLNNCEPKPTIKFFYNGSDLLKWLERSERPSLIFLDINMPGLTGLEVLRVLKREEKYKMIPVVMLTDSSSKNDLIRSYSIGVNAYIIKPSTVPDLTSRMEIFKKYWFDISKTPDSSWPRPDDLGMN